MFLSHPAYPAAKAKRDRSMLGKRWRSEDVVGQRAARLACHGQSYTAQNPISSRRKCPPSGTTFDHRCWRVPRFERMIGAISTRQTLTNEVRQGDEWVAYSTLGHTTATYHGMAYRSREPRPRWSHSSRGSDAPPGNGGKLRAGRRGPGGRHGSEARTRNAAGQPNLRLQTVPSTGKRGAWKACMPRLRRG